MTLFRKLLVLITLCGVLPYFGCEKDDGSSTTAPAAEDGDSSVSDLDDTTAPNTILNEAKTNTDLEPENLTTPETPSEEVVADLEKQEASGKAAGNIIVETPDETKEVEADDVCKEQAIPPGAISFSLPENLNPCSISGFFVGTDATNQVTLTGPNQFAVDAPPAGSHDLIVTGNLAVQLGLTSSASEKLGLRLNDITVVEGKAKNLKKLELLPLGSLKGVVKRTGQTAHLGIDVFIAGTRYTVKTAADGSFTFNDLPSGVHKNLTFQSDSYQDVVLSEVAIEPGKETTLADVSLPLKTAPSLSLFLDGDSVSGSAAQTTDLKVAVTLAASASAIFMRVSQDPQVILGQAYVPLDTVFEFDLIATSGSSTYTVYAQVKDADGLESSVVSQSITYVSGVATKFVILPPDDVTLGQNAVVTVEARNSDDQKVLSYQNDVQLVTSPSVTGAGIINIQDGVGTASLSGSAPGKIVLSLSDTLSTGLDVTSIEHFDFLSKPASKFVIVQPPGVVLDPAYPSGTPTNVTIEARNEDGEVATTYSGAVTINVDGSATGGGVVTLSQGKGVVEIRNNIVEIVNLTLVDHATTGLDVTSSVTLQYYPTPLFQLEGADYQAMSATSIAPPADYIGNGKGDLIVGAPAYSNNTGRVYVYSGGSASPLTTIAGENVGDAFGSLIVHIGDYNGDSYPDFAVGVPLYDGTAGADCGKVEIYSGKDRTVIGAFEGSNAGDQLGKALAGPGDVNHDGYADILFSIPYFDGPANTTDTGKVKLISGKDQAVLFEKDGFYVNQQFGLTVAGIGDFNRNGYVDIAITYDVYRGQNNLGVGKIDVYTTKDDSLIFTRNSDFTGDGFGLYVSGLGDINLDGRDDLAIAAPWHDCTSANNCGKIYIFSGADQTILFEIDGDKAGAEIGKIAAAGDFNFDGKGDLVIGAPSYDLDGQTDVGKVMVYSGADASLLFSQEGEASGDRFGDSVAKAGDFYHVNALPDGKQDIIVGAPGYDGVGGEDVGKLYVFSGTRQVLASNTLITEKQGASFQGYLSVRPAGDINGDGIKDFAYAERALSTGSNITLVAGGSLTTLKTHTGSSAYGTIYSFTDVGDLNHDGYDDYAIGAYGYDIGNNGIIRVYSGKDYSLITSVTGSTNAYYGKTVYRFGDYNKDGTTDLLLNDSAGAGVSRILSGVDLSVIHTVSGTGDDGLSISTLVVDYNRDGQQDLVVYRPGRDGTAGTDAGLTEILSGVDQSVLYSFEGPTANRSLLYVILDDFNWDGKPEFRVSDTTAEYSKYYNGADHTLLFSKTDTHDGFGDGSGIIGDYDGDGWKDFYVGANGGAGKLWIYSGKDYSLITTMTQTNSQELKYLLTLGDISGDGRDDFAARDAFWKFNGTGTDRVGKAWIYSGK